MQPEKHIDWAALPPDSQVNNLSLDVRGCEKRFNGIETRSVRDRTAKTSTMKSALTTWHSAAVVPGAPTPRMKETSAATAAAPLSSNASAPCREDERSTNPERSSNPEQCCLPHAHMTLRPVYNWVKLLTPRPTVVTLGGPRVSLAARKDSRNAPTGSALRRCMLPALAHLAPARR